MDYGSIPLRAKEELHPDIPDKVTNIVCNIIHYSRHGDN
jgi:hypothetical protein